MSELDFFAVSTEPQDDTSARRPERQVWCAALQVYVEDVRAYYKWLSWPNSAAPGDRGGAWRDFKSLDRVMLRRLCGQIGYDADAVYAGIKRALVKCA